MTAYVQLLGIPFVAIVVCFYALGWLIAWLGAIVITGLWTSFRAARWLTVKLWIKTVDWRVGRAI